MNKSENLSLESIAKKIALIYIIVAIIPHAIALRYTIAGFVALILIYQIYRGDLSRPKFNFSGIMILCVLFITVLSALISPYFPDSFLLLKKETAPFFLVLILVSSQSMTGGQRVEMVRSLFYAIIIGFFIKLALAVGDGIRNDWKFVIYDYPVQQKPKYLDFFSSDIHYYLPFLLGPLLFWKMNKFNRIVLGGVVLISILLAINSGIRTTFVVVAIEISVFVFAKFWRHKFVLALILSLVLIGAYLGKDFVTHPEKARIYGLFSAETYRFGKDGSISERQAIAKSVWDVNAKRFWIGYGPDWKNIAKVVRTDGFLNEWEKSHVLWQVWAANYYKNNTYGQANPHNLYLMIMFEIGAFGLACYLLSLLFVGLKGLTLFLNSKCRMIKSSGLVILVYVCSTIISGISGGPWLPITFLVAILSAQLLYVGDFQGNADEK